MSSNLFRNIRYYWDKFWYLLWKDDSPKGWVFSLIFLFVFIKFIFFPLLSLTTGTSLPLAIVESCSMYHDGNLLSNVDDWYYNHENKYVNLGISKDEFFGYSFKKGFNKGDILFIIGVHPEKLDIGDIVIFNAGQKNPVIHRIIRIEQDGERYTFSTIGDNNNKQLPIEIDIGEDQLVGKAVLRLVPYAGWGKLILFERLRPESERGFCKEN